MNEFRLGNGKGKTSGRRNATHGAQVFLKELNIASVRRGGDRDHQIIHIGEHYALGDHRE